MTSLSGPPTPTGPGRVAMAVVMRDLGLGQQRPDFEDRDHRNEANEQEEQRQEQPDRAEVGQEVPARRVISCPTTRGGTRG